MGLYSGVRFNVLISKTDSNVSSVSQPINITNDLGKVSLSQTKMLFFINLSKFDSMEKYNLS